MDFSINYFNIAVAQGSNVRFDNIKITKNASLSTPPPTTTTTTTTAETTTTTTTATPGFSFLILLILLPGLLHFVKRKRN
jgi:predicted S18 family serine protease